MTGTLHVVAVPIGNADDISLRALATLKRVAVVAAEDTRHFATLARHHGIGTRAVSYHDHNEESRGRELVERLRADGIPAVISGAGPTVMALADADTADKVEQLAGSDWAANRLSLDSQGASVLPLAG